MEIAVSHFTVRIYYFSIQTGDMNGKGKILKMD